MLLPGTRILIQGVMSLCSNGSTTLVGVGLLIVGASRLRSDTLHSAVLLWTSDRQKPHLTTHKIHKRLTSISQVGIEPAIPANERSKTHTLDCATTGTRDLQMLLR